MLTQVLNSARWLRNCTRWTAKRTPAIIANGTNRPVVNHYSGGYYILAPDMPSDTEETNPVLVLPTGDNLPNYDLFNSRQCLRAFVKRVLEFEALIDEIDLKSEEEKLNYRERPFDDFYAEIEKHLLPLNYLSAVTTHLKTNSASSFQFPSSCEQSAQRSRQKRFTSRTINGLMHSYNSQERRNNLNRYQRQIVDKYLLEGKLNGLSLDNDQLQKLQTIRRNLAEYRNKFRSNITRTTNVLQRTIMDAKLLGALPDSPSTLNYNSNDTNANYSAFMANCSERDLREEVFAAHNSRAFAKDKHTNNSVVIEEIRTYAKNQANLLGYANYAEMSMETKMAGSLDVVKTMINTLHAENQAQLRDDLDELTKFAQSKGEKINKIELWDLDYYRGRYHDEMFKSVSDADEMQLYFPLDQVLKGFFSLADRVFQIHVDEIPRGKFKSWHADDVRLFRIVSPNGSVGSFFFDPWARPDDKISTAKNYSRIEVLLNRSTICETQSISSWVLDLPRPLLKSNQQVNLTFNDVLRLAKGFGYILQCSIGEVPYSEINGFNNLEWDVVNITPEFITLMLLHDYRTIAECSRHAVTGQPLTKHLHEQLRKAHYKFNSIDLNRELYKSALDLSLYSQTEHWDDIVGEVWTTYSAPFTRHHKDFHLCSSTDIITEEMAASYYSPLWSKMLAAHIFSQFSENNVETQGIKYRDTFLSLAGGVPMKEIFREFCNSDPSPQHLLKLRALNSS